MKSVLVKTGKGREQERERGEADQLQKVHIYEMFAAFIESKGSGKA